MPTQDPQARATARQEAAKKLYGGNGTGGGSYDLSAANFFDRLEAKLRNDREGLANARRERQAVIEWARKHKVSPDALNVAMLVMGERDAHPLSAELAAQRAERTREELRVELGSEARD